MTALPLPPASLSSRRITTDGSVDIDLLWVHQTFQPFRSCKSLECKDIPPEDDVVHVSSYCWINTFWMHKAVNPELTAAVASVCAIPPSLNRGGQGVYV